MQTDFDNNLQSYFTDMEYLRGLFKEYVAAPSLTKRILVIHGVGGAGKSSLLRMFRVHCKSEKIPVALTSGDEAKSTLDVTTHWMEDLKADGIKFSSLNKTLETYRAIQAKVEDQAKKSQNKIANLASQAASKTAEAAGGAAAGALIGSVIPGVGTVIGGVVGGTLGSMGAEALFDWMRGFLNKSEIDLLLNPAKKLTTDFLEDLSKVAEKKRVVLLLDTYEQMSALEDWVGEIAQKIHPNVFFVVAGRKLPDWQRIWHGWMIDAQIEELKPMTEEIMRNLIHRYYATMRGGTPNPKQVDTIIKFARGLPMVVTSAVQLWVKYGVEDFQSIKAEIVANLVDRLMEGVPSSLIPTLEAAAIVRWFNQPILRAVTGLEDVRDVYNELRRFPFVRSNAEGLALHDSVREMIDENLNVQDSERHAELHERAAIYFEKQLEKTASKETERLGLERLYHRVRADEETGIKLFQEMAERLASYRLVTQLQTLVGDIRTYTKPGTMIHTWAILYNARILHLDMRYEYAAKEYQRLLDELHGMMPMILECRANALSYLAMIQSRREFLWVSRDPQRVLNLVDEAENLLPNEHPLHIHNLVTKGIVEYRSGNIDSSTILFEKAIKLFKTKGDAYGASVVYHQLKEIYVFEGNWRKLISAHQDSLSSIPQNTPLYKEIYGDWPIAWIWMGNYSEAEKKLKTRLEAQEQFGEMGVFEPLCALSYTLGMQGKYVEALQKVSDASTKYCALTKEAYYLRSLVFEAFILIQQGKWIEARKIMERVWAKQNGDFALRFYEKPEWYGSIYQNNKEWDQAERHYRLFLEINNYPANRYYHRCSAYLGLIQVKHAQGDIAAIPPIFTEAEQLAQQFEYNDHLASLRLTQGHLALETGKEEEAISFYQKAIIYALRYNRFLLDDLLSGRPQGTALQPIIPYCLKYGEQGKKILSTLRDWWKIGINDVGTSRHDTISFIPEGIPLLEAEKIAREHEMGDGSMQKDVIGQFETIQFSEN